MILIVRVLGVAASQINWSTYPRLAVFRTREGTLAWKLAGYIAAAYLRDEFCQPLR
jgi:hypothetical protein